MIIETVRCIIIDKNEKILLLQKSKDSRAALLFEFPGGKIDDIEGDHSTIDEQKNAVVKEVLEETGLQLDSAILEKTEEFMYSFTHNGRTFNRKVHVFCARIENFSFIRVNTTLNDSGKSEDKHRGFVFVSLQHLRQLLAENKISGNSKRFEKAFTK